MPLTHIDYGSAAKSDVLNNNFEYLDSSVSSLRTNAKYSVYYEILSDVTIDIPTSSAIVGTVYEVI